MKIYKVSWWQIQPHDNREIEVTNTTHCLYYVNEMDAIGHFETIKNIEGHFVMLQVVEVVE